MRLWGERDLLSATEPDSAKAHRGAFLVLVAAVLWGTSGSSQELLSGAVTPLAVGALRTTIGATGLVAWTVIAGRGGVSSLSAPRGVRIPLIAAGLCIALYQVTFFFGIDRLGIAVGTIVAIATAPFAAGLMSVALGQGRPTILWFAMTSLAVIGLTLLLRPGADATASPIGVVAALAAGASFGTYTVLTKRLLAHGLRRLDVVVQPFLIAAVLLVPALVVGIVRSEDPATLIRMPGALIVLWLGLGATALGYVAFAAGLGAVTAVSGATLVLAEPLTATLLGVLVFSERLGPTASLGALLVVLALLVTVGRTEREPSR